MAFNPDEYLKKKRAETVFDPDKYLAMKSAEAEKTAALPTEPEKEGETLLDIAIEKGKDVGRFVKGIPEEPAGSLKGFAGAVFKDVSPGIGMQPIEYIPKTEQEWRASELGKFGRNVVTGLATTAIVPGSGVVATLGKGAVANIPFVLEALEKGGWKGAGVDMIANTLIDVVTLGGAKYLKNTAIKKATQDILENGMNKASKESIDTFLKLGKDANKYIVLAEDGKTWIPTDELLNKITKTKKTGEKIFDKYDVSKKPERFFVKPVLTGQERRILAEKVPIKNTQLTEYLDGAKKYIEGRDIPQPSSVMKEKSKTVYNIVNDKLNGIGELKKETVNKFKDKTVSTIDVSKKFYELLKDRVGLEVNEAGKLVQAAGEVKRAGRELPLIKEMVDKINNLGVNTTVKQIDQTNSALSQLIRQYEKEGKPTSLSNGILNEIKKTIFEKLPDELKKVNTDYALTSEKRNWLLDQISKNKIYNTLTNPKLKIDKKPMVSSIMKDTGVNLQKEADFAEMAMNTIAAAYRQTGTEPLTIARFLAGGSLQQKQAATGIAKSRLQKIFGNYETQLRKYYIAKQKEHIKKETAEEMFKRALGLETVEEGAGKKLKESLKDLEETY